MSSLRVAEVAIVPELPAPRRLGLAFRVSFHVTGENVDYKASGIQMGLVDVYDLNGLLG